jgi:hypothetical protein
MFAGLAYGYVTVVHTKAYRRRCILVHCTIIQTDNWSIQNAPHARIPRDPGNDGAL